MKAVFTIEMKQCEWNFLAPFSVAEIIEIVFPANVRNSPEIIIDVINLFLRIRRDRKDEREEKRKIDFMYHNRIIFLPL